MALTTDYHTVWPIKVVSEANRRDHHFVKSKRVASQRLAVRCFWLDELGPKFRATLPVIVTLTRHAGRTLDTGDNLPGSFKAVRDELAALLLPKETIVIYKRGRRIETTKQPDDADPRLCFIYHQEKHRGPSHISVHILSASEEQVSIMRNPTALLGLVRATYPCRSAAGY